MSPSSPRGNLLPSVQPDSITVILSSYDSGRHLNQALTAILTQTRAAAQIIVVDDMSTDDSIEVIERARANSRIVELIRNPYRLGVLGSLNLALGRATSSLVAMLTAEDVPSPDFLMHSATVLETFPTAAFCCAEVEIIDEDSSVLSVRPLVNPPHGGHYFAPHEVRDLLRRGDNFFSGAFSLFRRSKLEEIGGFDSTLGCFADSVLQRRMAVRWGFCFIHRVLAARRITDMECAELPRTSPGNLDQMLLRAHRIIEAEPHGLFPKSYPQILVRRLRFDTGQMIAAKSRTDRNAAKLVAHIIKARKFEAYFLAWLGRTGRAAAVLTSV
jgi:cellulose synthase/poly-beta-1,6-N-acetylglucosamine synthase-like glycosyltransferase